jgi:site-specific recombinase XerC
MTDTFEKYLTESEERQLFRFVDQFKEILARRDLQWMEFMRRTGIRVTPMSLFTVGDALDAIATGQVLIRGETNKNGQAHTVILTNAAKANLRKLLGIRREMGHAPDRTQPLVMSRNNSGMSVRSYQDRVQKWCLGAGLGLNITPHWFRHTLAKRIVNQSTASDPRGIAMRVLGHQDIRTTMVYTQPDREDIQRAMQECAQ